MERPPRPVIQPGLALQPAEGGAHRVQLPGGPAANLPGNVLAIVSLCDGDRTLEDVVVALYTAGIRVPPQSVAQLLSQLSDTGILAFEPAHPPRVTALGNPRTRCLGCGRSCEGHRVGPLPETRVASLRKYHQELAQDYPRVANNPPIMTGRLKDGSELAFLNFPDERCVFLGDNRRCLLHAHYGADAKPDICNRFPVSSVLTGGEIRIGVKPFCYQQHKTFQDGDPVEPSDELVAEAEFREPTMPPSQDAAQRLMGHAQEVGLLKGLTEANGSLGQIMRLALGAPPSSELPPTAFEAIAESAGRVADFLAEYPKANSKSEHGGVLRQWQGALVGIGTWPTPEHPEFELPEQWWAFARFGLQQAVFLRETHRFPSVGAGLLALAVGVVLARWWSLQDAAQSESIDEETAYDRFGERVTGWHRLMCQSQAFVALFPDEKAIGELARAV